MEAIDWRQTRRSLTHICFFARVGTQTYPLRLVQEGPDVHGWLRRTDYRGPLDHRRDGWRIVWASVRLDGIKNEALAWASGIVTTGSPLPRGCPVLPVQPKTI
jgi:hypothetical protein